MSEPLLATSPPDSPKKCWGMVLRERHNRSDLIHCPNEARPNKLTCKDHIKLEGYAKKLRREVELRKKKQDLPW